MILCFTHAQFYSIYMFMICNIFPDFIESLSLFSIDASATFLTVSLV